MRLFVAFLLVIASAVMLGCETLAPASGNAFIHETAASDDRNINAVQVALAQSAAFNDVSINVLSEGGMVTLSGFVKTIKQYDTAVQIASEVPGVRGVRNHLVIRK